MAEGFKVGKGRGEGSAVNRVELCFYIVSFASTILEVFSLNFQARKQISGTVGTEYKCALLAYLL